MTENKQSGLFHSKSGGDYVLLLRGQEVCRYQTVADFVESHYQGIKALEESQVNLLEKYYRSIGVSPGKTPPR